MIITKEVRIELTNLNYTKLKKQYNFDNMLKIGDYIEISIDKLTKGSHIIIDVSCDYCDKELKYSFKDYNRKTKEINKISCPSKICCMKKLKENNLLKYGVEHTLQLENVKNKSKNTNLLKYGVENPSQSKIIKEKKKTTLLKNYGVDHFSKTDEYKEGIKKTYLENYGVEHYSKTDEYKERCKQTNLKNYGVNSYTKTDEYKERTKITNLEKYGVEHVSQSEIIKEKIKKTILEKYDVENYKNSDEYHSNTNKGNDVNFVKYLYDKITLFNCNKGHTFEINTDNYFNRIKSNTSLCTICNPIGETKSIKEKDLHEYIKSIYSGEIIQSYRDKFEIDIYLPELNIGFEFNGLYWHSEKFKEKNYHLDKTNYFKEKNIRIIHIWEDDWTLNQDIIKSQISNLLKNNQYKIFARKCIIKEVDIKTASKFLDDNHIQGFVSSIYKIGLYYNDELVSIMTFDSFEGRKKMEDGGYNLSRFCNKTGLNVIGGASKLLNHFIREYKATRIVSYADKDWSIGNLYYTLGFECLSESKPDYKYVVDNKRVHKSRYKKSKLKTTLTESQETKKLGINRIYDCGKIKFEYKIKKEA